MRKIIKVRWTLLSQPCSLILLIILTLFCTFTSHADVPAPSYLQLKFNGVPKKIGAILQQELSTPDYVTSPEMPESAVNRLVLYSYAEIESILKSEGYFHAKVQHSFLEKKSPKVWIAIYNIDLGAQVTIQDVHIHIEGPGQDEQDLVDIVNDHPLQIGTPFTQPHYNAIKSELLDTANNLGYFEAVFTETKIEIDEVTNQAWVFIILYTGVAYEVGEITINQNKPIFDPAFLSEFLSIHSGQSYDLHEVQESYNELIKTNYFDAIHIEPTPDPHTKKVNITINLTIKKPQQYTVGLGYGTETGPRALLGFQQRYITSTGQYFTEQAQISKDTSSFSVFYVIPGKDPRTDSHRIGGARGHTDVTPYDAHETSIGYGFLQHTENWEISLGANQYFVNYTENSMTRGHDKYLLPQVAVSYYVLDPEKHWNDGFDLAVDLTGTLKNGQLSDTSFFKNTTNIKYSYGFNAANRILVGSSIGVLGVSHISDLAPTLRFYAGGVNSVRGYSYKSLGPTDDQSYLTGGKYLITANINYERYLLEQVSGIVFYDIGNAYNDFHSLKFYRGSGVGLSWHSPIGPLKFYISKALSLPGDHWRFDLSIGAFL